MDPLKRLSRFGCAAVALSLLSYANAFAVTLQPGYAAQVIHEFEPGSTFGDAFQIDAAGVLYVGCGTGTCKVAPDGTMTPWSAFNTGLAISPTGDGYALTCGRKCILKLDPTGAASTLVPADSVDWIGLAIAPDGSLWGTNQHFGGRDALCRIDPATGQRTIVSLGGPLPVGQGVSVIYGSIAFGGDGQLYLDGTVYGAMVESRIFRLDGSDLVPLATLAHGGALHRGMGASLFVCGNYTNGAGYIQGDVWRVDVSTGVTGLIASSSLADQTLEGGPYSPDSGRLYVLEGGHRIGSAYLNPKLWAITGVALPVEVQSWGSVKVRYR